ncbi:hypothetical protein SAMD00019534_117460 [Acytostelium subglobosum LB1]|uniref:hypothetical protein n=1 Tax=Acytostelium subglobosum LB1 TaxID=1410327 RepID=UPI0006451314|nr:hypothetical protein SAMD00019534_117460 [Acytostelium subglobosum LB1]GAM28570.1 hypothetical protein SAMD00019534_117460 [Acytostelium subglobosum LB1]|eukprot:XP_012748609.1 hypothetical protein SAMD00019534_117460 [Acytostelium subglobosum LB1]
MYTEFRRVQEVEEAAASGQISFIDHTYRTSPQYIEETASFWAAGAGQMEVIKYLHGIDHIDDTPLFSEGTMFHAALGGHMEVLLFLHNCRTEGCTSNTMDHAAKMGHLDIVQFLHANRTEGCTDDALVFAARSCHLDIVKFLYDNRSEGCVWRAYAYACDSSDNRDVCEYLSELPCREHCPHCHNSHDMELFYQFVDEMHRLDHLPD